MAESSLEPLSPFTDSRTLELAGGAPQEYASSRLDTSPPYGNYFTIRTPFIPAAAWLGSVQR